jgi:hypothetical protein
MSRYQDQLNELHKFQVSANLNIYTNSLSLGKLHDRVAALEKENKFLRHKLAGQGVKPPPGVCKTCAGTGLR